MKQELVLPNSDDPASFVLRALFTFWLNTGALDARMIAEGDTLKYGSARTDIVGLAFMDAHQREIRDEFAAWSASNELATFMLDNRAMVDSVEDALGRRRADGARRYPLDTLVGERFKKLTGFDKKRMPKDPRKSFLTKMGNRLAKLADELANPSSAIRKMSNGEASRGPGFKSLYPSDLEGWLRHALQDSVKNGWLPSEPLREIKNLYWKLVENGGDGDVDHVVEELLKSAIVMGVMGS